MLRRFGPDDAIEDAHHLPRGLLADIGFGLAQPALTGAITDQRWRESIVERLIAVGIDRGRARSAVTAWSRVGEPIPEALDLIRQARKRCRVALFTNATTRLPDDLRLLGLDTEVDAVVSSARIGMAKPAPGSFRRALRVLQHSAGMTVFCDDRAENAEAARRVGIDGVHVPDTAALRFALRERGLLDVQPEPEPVVPMADEVLIVLPDREDAERLAAGLAANGWAPAAVHKELLAGEDDAEAADWVVELLTAPDGTPASTRRDWLDALAEEYDGFTSDHG